MSCIEVLRNWEENIEALEMLEALIQYVEEMPSEELLEEIYVDGFAGYEYMLLLIMITSSEGAMARAWKRLVLELFRREIQSRGEKQVVERMAELITEEKQKWDEKYAKLKKAQEQVKSHLKN